MPAKPLQSVKRNASFHLNPDAPRAHPELAALVACVITDWARVEANLGVVLLIMLGAKSRPAAAMFASLKSQQAKNDTLLAVAKVSLSAEHASMVDAVLRHLGKVANVRNQLAHGVWATSSELPDALLVMDAKVELAFKRDRVQLGYQPPGQYIERYNPPKIHPKDVFVCKKDDLEEAIAMVSECYRYTNDLCMLCYPNTIDLDTETNKRDLHRQLVEAAVRKYDWLCKQPQLRKYLNQTNRTLPDPQQSPP